MHPATWRVALGMSHLSCCTSKGSNRVEDAGDDVVLRLDGPSHALPYTSSPGIRCHSLLVHLGLETGTFLLDVPDSCLTRGHG